MTSFNVAMNGFSVEGAAALALALKTNCTLTDVDITCNRIFDVGAMEISKALLKNETLRFLRVCHITIGSKVVNASNCKVYVIS